MPITRFVNVVQRRPLTAEEWLVDLIAPLFAIETHMSMEERGFLVAAALRLPEGFVACEVGSFLGASAAFTAAVASVRGGRLHCVDTWDGRAMDGEAPRETFAEFQENTRRFAAVITPHRGESVKVAADVPAGLDLLFIDGDHSYEGARADVFAYAPKLKPGGLLLVHDFDLEPVRRACEEYLATHPSQNTGGMGTLQSFQILQ